MKFMLPVRAFWPLLPRPAVLPVPDACPRPTRFFSFTPPPRGWVNLVSSFIVVSPRVAPLARPFRAYTLEKNCHSPRSTQSGENASKPLPSWLLPRRSGLLALAAAEGLPLFL